MSKKSAKTSKREATKKTKTGSTKAKKSRTASKRTTSRTWYVDLSGSNLKGISNTMIGGNLSQWFDVTPTSTFEFSLRRTTSYEKAAELAIRIGPNGLEYRLQSDVAFQKIG